MNYFEDDRDKPVYRPPLKLMALAVLIWAVIMVLILVAMSYIWW